jgi:PIN domain nuclease of toxin-antitoxin system
MNYLLDTHTFLWYINDDPMLSTTAKVLMADIENTVYLSSASIWEMAIKVSLGKLEVPSPFHEFVDRQLSANSIRLLEIKVEHFGLVATLPFHHPDPFDRLLIAQSLTDNVAIIGRDEIFDAYGVKQHW